MKQSVSELVNSIKYNLESAYDKIEVEGEIQDLKVVSGHYYFTLVDSLAQVKSVMFSNNAKRSKLESLVNGDLVIASGKVEIYSKRGSLQLNLQSVEKSGSGKLLIKLEELKKKLRSEGLFDLEHKVEIPKSPKKVALITALGGAALIDFLRVIKSRHFLGNILIIPSLVQGVKAPRELINALDMVDKVSKIDLVVITRGGGSLEDLFCFNDESLIRRVFLEKIPVVSAIGHEVDFTLLDEVADLRAATPTAAAMLITNFSVSLYERMDNLKKFLNSNISNSLQLVRNRLIRCSTFDRFLKLSEYQQRLDEALLKLTKINQRLASFKIRLSNFTPVKFKSYINLDGFRLKIDRYLLIFKKTEQQTVLLKEKIVALYKLLSSLSPDLVLNRGYSLISLNDKIISSLKEFEKINTTFEIHFKDGTSKANPLKKR